MKNSCVIFGKSIRNLSKLTGNKEVKILHTPNMLTASISELFWSEFELSMFNEKFSGLEINDHIKPFQFFFNINNFFCSSVAEA